MVEEGQAEQQELFEEIANEARNQGFFLQMTPAGPVLIPMVEGHPWRKRIPRLERATRKELEAKQAKLRKKLQAKL